MAYLTTVQSLKEMRAAHITLAMAARDVDIVAMYIDLAELMSHQLRVLLEMSPNAANDPACICMLSCELLAA
jgi:hypothetical protein